MEDMGRIDETFEQIPREVFLPEGVKKFAGEDRPLGIGYGQTNSQPTTVKWMLQWLDVRQGQKVLDVGSGSGWTSALLSHLVGPGGTVEAVERVPELVAFGQKNCEKLGLKNITFYQAGERFGLPDKAPFDCILVSAGANRLPEELVEQLKPGGIMVIPVKHDILVVHKKADKTVVVDRNRGFTFVPLLT